MGNCEVRGLIESVGSVDDDALLSLHRQFMTYGERQFPVDRSGFALLIRGVRFAVVDQVYDALFADAERREEVVNYRDLVLALVIASTLDMDTKARLLHEALLTMNGEATVDSVAETVANAAVRAVVPMRGEEDRSGKIAYPAYRCHGCRQVPQNLVYRCLDCPASHSVMGIFSGVTLCKGCSGTWEGPGTEHTHHSTQHRLEKLKHIANPKSLVFPGTGCSSCGASPIVGARLRCLDCTDMTELCGDCYSQGSLPGAHTEQHVLEQVTQQQTLHDEVYRLLFDIGFAMPSTVAATSKWAVAMAAKVAAGQPTRIGATAADVQLLTMHDLSSPQLWQQWAARSERLLPLLGGCWTHYAPRCLEVESYDRDEVIHGTTRAKMIV